MKTVVNKNKSIRTIIAKVYGVFIILGIMGTGLYVLNYLSSFWSVVVPLWQSGEGREEIQIPLQRGDEAKVFLSAFNITQISSLIVLLISGWFACRSYNNLMQSRGTFLSILFTIFFGLMFLGLQIYHYIEHPYILDTSFLASPLHMTILYYLAGIQGYALLAGILFFLIIMVFVKVGYVTAEQPFAFRTTVWHWYFVVGLWCLIFAMMLWRSYLWGL